MFLIMTEYRNIGITMHVLLASEGEGSLKQNHQINTSCHSAILFANDTLG